MRLVNTINGLLLLVLGMLISASVTSTIYRPDVTTVGQVESRDSERGNEQEKRERLILPDDGCCMYAHRQHAYFQ